MNPDPWPIDDVELDLIGRHDPVVRRWILHQCRSSDVTAGKGSGVWWVDIHRIRELFRDDPPPMKKRK